jgi:hypothetical protein
MNAVGAFGLNIVCICNLSPLLYQFLLEPVYYAINIFQPQQLRFQFCPQLLDDFLRSDIKSRSQFRL